MMKLQKSQKGITMFTIAFYLGLLVFVALTVLKLFPVYMESFAVASSVNSMNSGQVEYSGALAVRSALMRKLGFNNVENVTMDDISVTRADRVYMIDVNYEVRIPYIKNINLIVSFENHAEVPAR
jgi:hypothetical protein